MTRQAPDPGPLYKRVKSWIVRGIDSGRIKPNQKLPSEHALVGQFGFSRMTVHRALRELTAEGYLTRIPGVGTFAAAARVQFAVSLQLRDIAEEIGSRGNRHSAQVANLQAIRADADLAATFALPVGERLFRSIVVHRENGVPIQLEERIVVPQIAPNYLKQDFTRITPYEYLLKCSRPTEFEHLIYAVTPDRGIRTLLDMAPNEPCILVRRRSWVGALAATLSKFFYPGSRYHLYDRRKA